MKHTPGPWTIHDTHDGGLAVVEAECLRIMVDHREDFGRAKPDAYLIAAAPDLLVACKALLKWSATEPLAKSYLALANIKALAQLAIAKAEGDTDG